MLELDQQSTEALIRDVDALARAAYIWVRQQTFEQRFIGQPLNAAEESELAAGFLTGLQLGLGLGRTESMLVTYSYVLMAGRREAVPEYAREVLIQGASQVGSSPRYKLGLEEAGEYLKIKTTESGNTTEFVSVYGIGAATVN